MVESLAAYLKEVFGIELRQEELRFEIFPDEESTKAVDEFLGRNQIRRRQSGEGSGELYSVLNLSAKDAARRISVPQAKTIAAHLGVRRSPRTILVVGPDDAEMRAAVGGGGEFERCIRFPAKGEATLLQLASLVEGAVCVFTPDTSIVHFASAFGNPVFGFFTTMQGMQEWLPYRVPHDLLVAPAGQPASTIPLADMTEGIDRFLNVTLLK